MKNKTDNPILMNDRRSFIRSTALLAGGALLVNPLARAYATGSDVIKIAIVGCGGRGTGALFQALSTKYNVKLVAMGDVFRDHMDKCYTAAFKKFGADKIQVPEEHKFIGFDAYIHAIALADVVLLTTPPGFRPIHFEEAVKQNKHIFMEKPVATDAPGVRRVLAAAEEAKKKKLNTVVGLQRRYQNNYRETIKRIHDGAVGDIVAGQVTWNGGGLWVFPRQPGQTEMEHQMRNWYYFTWICGDHIVEQHIHNIDVANWVKNSYPITAYGAGSRFLRTGKEYGEIFDNHSIQYVYDDGTVLSSQCRHYLGTQNKIGEDFQGTKGRANLAVKTAKLTDLKGNVLYNHDNPNDPNAYQTEHDELFAAISAGEYKFADAERGARSTLTAIMGRLASYSGHEIKLNDALNSNISLAPDTFAWDAMPKVLPDKDGVYPHAIPGKTKVI